MVDAAAFDANVERLKACEHIAEGEEGWEALRNLCPSTAAVASLRDERDEMALRWSNCAMRNAIALREIQLLAAAGLESGCVEGDDEYTLFTSIHRLSCEQQGTGSATVHDGKSTDAG